MSRILSSLCLSYVAEAAAPDTRACIVGADRP